MKSVDEKNNDSDKFNKRKCIKKDINTDENYVFLIFWHFKH